MNAWRRIAVLCSGGRLFEPGAAMNFRDTVGQRALTLLGLIDRQRRSRQRSVQAEPPEFAPDTDIQVFFMDDDEPARGDIERTSR